MPAKIIIGADIVPTSSNKEFFENENMEQIVDENVLKVLSSSDYRIFNLEVPLTDKEEAIKKFGPNLIASVKSVNGLKALGIDFLTLANNHIMDQGEQGLMSTTRELDKVGIAYSGVGMDLSEAAEPHVFELDGKKIGIYCCAEHEFSIADEDSPGANPFDPLESLDHISALKKRCDYVICLYHGGKEHYRYPAPYLRKTCRKIVEKGADLVICQHSHCIGCEEKWLDGTIVYGQGNFLFDHSNNECWKTGLLISINIDEGIDINYLPVEKEKNGVRLGNDDILNQFYDRSLQIQDERLIFDEYEVLAKTQLLDYIAASDYLCTTTLFKILNKLSRNRLRCFVANRKLKKNSTCLINQFECEAHRELILKGLHGYEKQ